MTLTNVYRTFHSTTAEYTLFSRICVRPQISEVHTDYFLANL